MKRKLFCLLTLLLTVCSGAWAADAEFVIYAGGSTAPSSSKVTDATTRFAYTCANFKGDLIDVSAFTNHGTYTKALRYGGGTTSPKNHVKLEVPLGYTATIDLAYSVQTGQSGTFGISTDGTKPNGSNCSIWNAAGTAGTVSTAQIADLEGNATYYIGGSNDKCLIVYLKVTLTEEELTAPTITTQPTDGVYQKDATGKKLTVEATPSTGECAYQWYSCQNGDAEDTPVSLGSDNGAQTAIYTIPTDAEGTFYYFCIVSDGGSNTTPSDVATVRILDQTPVSTWNLSSLTANDIQYDSFWTGSDNSFTNASAIAGNTDTTIPNSFGGDLLNGIKIGAASGIGANNLYMFINYYGVYGLRVNATAYFKIPATPGKYYRITHTASMNDGENTVGFAINNSSATLIDGDLTAAISNVAVPNVFIIRADASTIELTNAGTAAGRTVLTKIEEMDILSASWKRSEETVTSDSFYEGDTAPTAPTLNVTSSKGTSLTGDEYSVAYETSDADIVAVNASTGITEIKNTKTGTATVTATLTTSTEGFMVVTNTYTYTVTVNAKVPTYVLDKADNEISLRSTPLHRSAEPAVSETATVTMSADFLAGTSGTVAFTTDVDGLSVSPAAFTISEGSVAETEFTITYNSASGASGTATLRFSDGTNNKDLVIEYASVVPHEWATVSETTTWDWTTFGYARNASVKLTTETTPTKSEEFNFADMDGEVLAIDAKIPVSFNGAALLLTSEYPIRDQSDNEFWQGSKIRIKTSVPGRLYVKYSNTGGNPERFLTINGAKRGEGTSNATFKELSDVAVPAGIITLASLEGETPSNLRIQKIIFTADPGIGQKSIEITCEGGLASYSCTTDGLDFSNSNVKAYIVTAKSSSYATLKEVTKAPANTGLIIMGTKGQTYNVLTTDEATPEDVEGNLLEATGVSGTAVEKDAAYVLSKTDGKLHLTNAGTIPAGKAYLPAGAVDARILDLSFGDEGETTAISEVRGLKADVRGEFYDLSGRKVAQPTKGLYIVNGRKVVIK